MLVASLTNSGLKNQVPQFFFKFAVGDLVLVSSYEVADILFCESLDISEAISYYGAQAFALHGHRPHPPSYMITCTLPYSDTDLETSCIRLDTFSSHMEMILPHIVQFSRMQHLSFLVLPQMVRILKHVFSLISVPRLLYMVP